MRISKYLSIVALSMVFLFSGCKKNPSNIPTVSATEGEDTDKGQNIEPTIAQEKVPIGSSSNTSEVEITENLPTTVISEAEPNDDPTTSETSEKEKQELNERVKVLINKSSKDYPDDVEILDAVEGDIGKDGTQEIAAVLQYKDSDGECGEYFSRILCIFTQEKDDYALSYRNDQITPNSNDGGVFGDPYSYIKIDDGVFTLSIYGGSSDRWEYDYFFEEVKNELVLVKIVNTNTSTFSYIGTETIYDFANGSVETYSYSYYYESFVPLILYRGTFEPVLFSLSEVTDLPCYDISMKPQYPMPSLNGYDYLQVPEDNESIEIESCKFSTEEILDSIKNKYYSDMKKVKLPCEQEILDNYSTFIGYDAPSYYYECEDGELSYLDMESNSGMFKKHTVMYKPYTEEGVYEFYYVWDDTGEEVTYDE